MHAQAEAMARFEVVPPARMVKALKEGQLDVCCVGEPYGTLAEFENVGHVVAHSDEFWPSWPEKVLGLTEAGALALVVLPHQGGQAAHRPHLPIPLRGPAAPPLCPQTGLRGF